MDVLLMGAPDCLEAPKLGDRITRCHYPQANGGRIMFYFSPEAIAFRRDKNEATPICTPP